MRGLGWARGLCLGRAWGPSSGVGGGGGFSLRGFGVCLLRTGESGKQVDEWEVKEDDNEEEEFVEGFEENSPGTLFLFLGGVGLKGLWVLGWVFFFGWGARVSFGLGVGVCFGLGGRFWDHGEGLGGGGGGSQRWLRVAWR